MVSEVSTEWCTSASVLTPVLLHHLIQLPLMPSIDPPAPFHPTASRRTRNNVRVGVGVLVVSHDNKVYAGIRKGSHGAGTLALPGGHLEMYESWEDCAIREVKEEMDVDIVNVQLAHVCNNPMPDEEKHYVTIFMMGRLKNSAKPPVNVEPEKCKGWSRYSWSELQQMANTNKLFSPLQILVSESPLAVIEYLSAGTSSEPR